MFETDFAVLTSGQHRLRVTDPMANEVSEVEVDVTQVSIERRSATRNSLLQKNIALETEGRAYDLMDVDRFPDDFQPARQRESNVDFVPLGQNWFIFAALILLLSIEWMTRKALNLT